jgi:hypothetical protein
MRLPLWAFAAAVLSASVHADTPVDFSGTWVVNDSASSAADKSSSDSTHARSQGAGGHGGHGGGRGGGMGGGMGGGGHHGRSAPNASNGGADVAANAPAAPRSHAHALIIRQSDVVFDIAADGARTAYRFDNRNNYGAQYGGTVNLAWSAPDMVIETHPDGGGVIEEHYTLSADGKKLTLDTRIQRAGEDTAHEVKRVFERNDEGAAALP